METRQKVNRTVQHQHLSTSSHLLTSTHTGSRVKADGGRSLLKVLHGKVANDQKRLRRPQLLAQRRQMPELRKSSLRPVQSDRSDRPISLFSLTRLCQALARSQPSTQRGRLT